MSSIVQEYLRKVLELGCNIEENDDLIVFARTDINELKEELLKLKDEYKINSITFIEKNNEKIYDFLKGNPADEEIKKFVNKYPDSFIPHKTKMISICDDDHSVFYNLLSYESDELYDKYDLLNKYDYEINKSFWDLINKIPCIGITCPNKYWSNILFNNDNSILELYKLINSIIPNSKNFKEEMSELKRRRQYLEDLKISQLNFYTDLGTDFKIGITKNSLWCSEPSSKNGKEFFYNFPSYEIYTSPNCYSMEGKVVISKPSSIYGERINTAELSFTKGKCVSCSSDNDNWNELVLNKENNLFRVGEIALVANTSPIAKLNRVFNSVLLDENSGSHMALGNSIRECINIPSELLNKNGFKYYRFNKSDYHQDLVFGNASLCVEAITRNRNKVLLLEKGKWQV